MNTNKERKRTNLLSRKTVIVMLLLLSFVVTTGTLAYWANDVEGANGSQEFTFQVGSLNFIDYDFTLEGEYIEGSIDIDASILTKNNKATGESIDVIFGAIWEDLNREVRDGFITIGYIELDYSVYAEIDGVEVNSKKYTKINRVLDIEFDSDNPYYLVLNDPMQTFGMTIGVDQNGRRNDYKVLGKSDVTITVTYRIYYEYTYQE